MLFNNAHYVFEAFNRAMAFFCRCSPNHRVLYTEFWDGFSLVVSWKVQCFIPAACCFSLVQGSWLRSYQGGCSSLWPLCSVYCSPCMYSNCPWPLKRRVKRGLPIYQYGYSLVAPVAKPYSVTSCEQILLFLTPARITFMYKFLRITYTVLHDKKQFTDRPHDRTMQHAKHIMH